MAGGPCTNMISCDPKSKTGGHRRVGVGLGPSDNQQGRSLQGTAVEQTSERHSNALDPSLHRSCPPVCIGRDTDLKHSPWDFQSSLFSCSGYGMK